MKVSVSLTGDNMRGHLHRARKLVIVMAFMVTITSCGFPTWEGTIYRIGPIYPDDHQDFSTLKKCEEWVAEQIKNGNAVNGDCEFWLK
jgi:hypothetical protein